MKNNVIKICSSFLIASLVLAFSACYTAQDGLSAYEIAVKNGFVGSESEWIESLKGKDGIDGIDGKLNIKIPAGVQSSNKLRISGKGYKSGISRGDLLGKIKIVVPEKLTEDEKKLFKELAEVSNFEPRKVY